VTRASIKRSILHEKLFLKVMDCRAKPGMTVDESRRIPLA
jgi:hypothetical protein